MIKERIKSFILILLILNSVNLTVQMWFDSNLMSGGNPFGEMVRNIPIVGGLFDDDTHSSNVYTGEELYDMTTKPRRVIVNGGGAREVYLKDSDYYNEAMQYVEVFMDGIKDEDVQVKTITYAEWKNLFKAKSIFIDFGYSMDSSALNRLYGLSGKFQQAQNFAGFIITPETMTKSCTLCMLNCEDYTVTEFSFKADCENIMTFIEETTYQKQQNDAFAFEINLDEMTAAENEVERKVAFSPLALLNVTAEMEKDITLMGNDIFGTPEDFEAFAERMLQIFGYKASSLRKTVQSDGSITFVENNATIKFYYDGTIEYQAVSTESGLKVSNENADCYQAICDVMSVAGTVWEKSGMQAKALEYHLVSDYMDNKDNIYTIKVDNMYEGTVINYHTVMENALYAQVDKGYITKFVIHLSNINELEQKSETLPVLMAIDTVYSKYGDSDMIIDDVYKCYDFDESGKGIAKWMFRVRGDENSIVVDTAELY